MNSMKRQQRPLAAVARTKLLTVWVPVKTNIKNLQQVSCLKAIKYFLPKSQDHWVFHKKSKYTHSHSFYSSSRVLMSWTSAVRCSAAPPSKIDQIYGSPLCLKPGMGAKLQFTLFSIILTSKKIRKISIIKKYKNLYFCQVLCCLRQLFLKKKLINMYIKVLDPGVI